MDFNIRCEWSWVNERDLSLSPLPVFQVTEVKWCPNMLEKMTPFFFYNFLTSLDHKKIRRNQVNNRANL